MNHFTPANWTEMLAGKYENPASPDARFVLREVRLDPCDKLIQRLQTLCEVDADTDENYDVGFGCVLSTAGIAGHLPRISMIGPLAFLSRLNQNGTVEPPLPRDESSITEFQRRVLDMLLAEGIEPMDGPTPESSVGTDKPLFQWLFIDEDEVPWR